MASVTLEAVQLSKRYGSRSAVEDVSFVAHSGDVVGFLGPNGAGKTTMIRLLTTVLAPTSGTFWVAGQPPTAPAEIRRRVGVLPESSGYPRHQTGREYLRYHARLYGMSSSAARGVADRLLAELGLAERAGSPISAYSRGMRQRLGIARALVQRSGRGVPRRADPGPRPRRSVSGPRHHSRHRPEPRCHCRAEHAHAARGGGGLLECADSRPRQGTGLWQCRGRHRDRGGRAVRPSCGSRLEHVPAGQPGPRRCPWAECRQVVGQPDVLSISLRRIPGRSVDSGRQRDESAVMAVAEAGVPVLSFQVEGARLSDAYRKMTATDVR